MIIDENTIISEILPFLSDGMRGIDVRHKYLQIVQAILYKLKTGCQWKLLPVKMFFEEDYSYSSVYHHFRRWIDDGSWIKVWASIIFKFKHFLDLSCILLDGSHTVAKKGGQAVSYQNRKKAKTTNMLFLTDNTGLIVGLSEPISGKHHDVYDITNQINEVLSWLKKVAIRIDGLFLNADPGFDCKELREVLDGKDIIANIKVNPRNSPEENDDKYFDEELYKKRSTCEHTFAWMDSFRTILNRFETRSDTWFSMNLIASFCIFLRRLEKAQIIPL